VRNALVHRGFQLAHLRFDSRISPCVTWARFMKKYSGRSCSAWSRSGCTSSPWIRWRSWAGLGPSAGCSRRCTASPRGASGPSRRSGCAFPTRSGLAAGFDKNARAWPAAAALGFGHVEIGTVTALAQPGNPRPRMFRYPRQEAVINRLGFNNQGSEAVAARLSRQPPPGKRRIPVGINLGKSKVAEIDRAPEDYLASFARLAGPRRLHRAQCLEPEHAGPAAAPGRVPPEGASLGGHERKPGPRASAGGRRVPILLKIAPDLGFSADRRRAGGGVRLSASTASSRRTRRSRGRGSSPRSPNRGASAARRCAAARLRSSAMSPAPPGGGCRSSASGASPTEGAAEKLDAGAALVQVYTGMIYRGPFFAADLARGVPTARAIGSPPGRPRPRSPSPRRSPRASPSSGAAG
jgi:dihydroorotate dehydrogenase